MSRYVVHITPSAWDEVKDLPGHMRQRIRRVITALADEPRPAESKALVRLGQNQSTDPNNELPDPIRALRRFRLERWRIVDAITESENAVDILTVRKRPPYDYGDIERLLAAL